MKDLEDKKDNSNKYFTAVRNLTILTPNLYAFNKQDKQGNIANTANQQTATNRTHFIKYFKEIKIKNDFTGDEIR